jgi:hypothetical protein
VDIQSRRGGFYTVENERKSSDKVGYSQDEYVHFKGRKKDRISLDQ